MFKFYRRSVFWNLVVDNTIKRRRSANQLIDKTYQVYDYKTSVTKIINKLQEDRKIIDSCERFFSRSIAILLTVQFLFWLKMIIIIISFLSSFVLIFWLTRSSQAPKLFLSATLFLNLNFYIPGGIRTYVRT